MVRQLRIARIGFWLGVVGVSIRAVDVCVWASNALMDFNCDLIEWTSERLDEVRRS